MIVLQCFEVEGRAEMRNRLIKMMFISLILLISFSTIDIASPEIINVGIYQNLPLVGADENSNPKGFFVDIWNYVAENENLSINYKIDSLENSFKSLEEGNIDLLLAVAYSNERSKKYIYNNETVYTNWGQIYSASDHLIDSFLDLEGLNIGVEKGDIHYIGENGIVTMLEDFGVSVNYIEYSGRLEMFSDLDTGVIDAAVVSRLFGEYYKSNYDIKLTPIQFNPIKIKVIISDPKNEYLLNLFDKQMQELKNDSYSIYYKGLNNLLSFDGRLSLPEDIVRIIVALIVALIVSIIAIVIGRKIIQRQGKKLVNQNLKLKRIVNNISEISSVKTMEVLFTNLVNQLKNILENDKIEVVSLIEFEEGLYLDTSNYLTNQYKKYESKKIEEVPLKYYNNKNFLDFKESIHQIQYNENCILVKFDSSYNRQGFLYIESENQIEDTEYLQIYLSDIKSNLQKIVSNIKRVNEKIKLFVAVGELIEKRDTQVANHVKRVSEATLILAEACGYCDEELNNIVIASSVHDIGKIFVPDYILNKPGKLTKEEFEIIKTHASDDLKMIDEVGETLAKTVHDVVRYHHENWDGSGYPEGLIKESIPYEARIVSIIDVFEALTHKRPYKKAWNYEEAREFITKNKGVKFDPQIVEIFEETSDKIFKRFSEFKDDSE